MARRPPLVECGNDACSNRARTWARLWFCSSDCRRAQLGLGGSLREQQRQARDFFESMRARRG